MVALPPAARGACNAAGRRVWLWPVTLRHLGRGHGRSPDHRPLGGCSAFVGGGEPHETVARPPALWSCGTGRRQGATAAAAGNMAAGWLTCQPLRLALSLEKTDLEAVDSAETACEGTLSAEMRYSCAACHTLHDAARDRQWPEHSGQRPRESGAWVASSARHPCASRGSSLRATDSSEPLSALFASSSSMSSRSHTACRRIWPRIWSTSQLHLSALGLPALTAAASRELQSRKSRHPTLVV